MAVPIPFFGPLVLTRSGRPALQDNEVEYIIQPDLELVSTCEASGGGVLSLTSHRLLWVAGEKERAGWLSGVERASLGAKSMFSKKRTLSITLSSGFESGELEFVFREGGEDEFLDALHTSIERRAWEAVDKRARSTGFQASSAGISGLMRKQEQERRATGKLAEEAFIDLKALMSKAREVVGRGSDRDGRDTVHCVISITALE